MEKKITRKEVLVALRDQLVNGKAIEIPAETLVEHLDAAITQIDKKAEKAKERAEKAHKEGDDLRAEIESHLTSQLQTIDQIAEVVVGKDVTKAKIVARLTQLVNAGLARKDSIKVDSRKLMGYALVTASEVIADCVDAECVDVETEEEDIY